MGKEKELSKKIDVLETEYRKENQQIEENIDDVQLEKKLFQREIESLADWVRQMANREEEKQPELLQQAYRLVGNAQEEGQEVVKKTVRTLEMKKEENQLSYQKQKNSYRRRDSNFKKGSTKIMLETAKEELLNIRKNLEKQLISMFVASQSHATSENRKKMVKLTEKEKISGLESSSKSYLSSFKTSAKGRWVKQAEQTLKQTTDQVTNL